MRDFSKKRMEQFNKKVEALVKKLGGTESPSYHKWQIQTKAGILFVSVHEPSPSGLFSIFCRFDDEKKAAEVFGKDNGRLNYYSGKWNWHEQNEEYCLETFEYNVKIILEGI